VDWTLFEHLDRMRQLQGTLLDAFGLGPVEAPYRETFTAAGVSLRRYGSSGERGPLVLIVPAPIKRPYIYEGDVGVSLQHVGPLVGRRAHALLWPRIVEWIDRVRLGQTP